VGNSADAAALMNSHLVDLLSGLDLTDKVEKSDSLADLLRA
ncbi:MAG: GntR family transcriptional regulator, partial [Mesorhizobium sp.]